MYQEIKKKYLLGTLKLFLVFLITVVLKDLLAKCSLIYEVFLINILFSSTLNIFCGKCNFYLLCHVSLYQYMCACGFKCILFLAKSVTKMIMYRGRKFQLW